MKNYIAPAASGKPAPVAKAVAAAKPAKPTKDVNAPKRALTPFFNF